MSRLFDPQVAADAAALVDETVGKQFGERYNGRYHLPLLPGEAGTKAGGDWVPYGVMSATNLAGAIVDSRALSIWERERSQLGLAIRPELFERMVFAVNSARSEGVDFAELHASNAGKALVRVLTELHEDAKTACGGNQASIMGTNRHDAWEARAVTGRLFGTPQVNAEIEALEALLDANGLERVPGLQERVVRNDQLKSGGKLDDVLMSRKTGRLYLADLKTKRKQFYSWLEAWIQQAVYATSPWMLNDTRDGYIPGPAHHVDQKSAILLRAPSDGAAPYLQRVDLELGVKWARLARDVVEARSEARSVKSFALAEWREEA